jgi:uncharacterized damage-inducible protein DinB
MARYNRWMNERLRAFFPSRGRRAQARADFGLMHGTLNHLLWVTGWAWLPHRRAVHYPAFGADIFD